MRQNNCSLVEKSLEKKSLGTASKPQKEKKKKKKKEEEKKKWKGMAIGGKTAFESLSERRIIVYKSNVLSTVGLHDLL